MIDSNNLFQNMTLLDIDKSIETPIPFILISSITLVPIYMIDVILRKLFGHKSRWFQLHAVINIIVTYISLPEVYDIICNPMNAFDKSSNRFGLILGLSLHLYHMIFFELTFMDKCHHISSAFICIPLTMFLDCKIISWHLFIGTGLPGGIDYIMLSFVKNSKLQSLKEKKYNGMINAYLRGPFGVIGSFLTYMRSLTFENGSLRQCCGLIVTIISFLNCTFFAKLAIENYRDHYAKKMKQKLN